MERNFNEVDDFTKTLKEKGSEEVKKAIITLVTNFLKQYGNIEEVRKALSANKVYWRDNLIKQEQNLVRILKDTPADKEAKMLVAETLLDYSEKIILFAHRDIVNPEKRINKNPVVNLINTLVEGFDLEDKKKFWIDTFDLQKEIVFDVLSQNLDKEIDLRASKVFINYTNIMMLKLEKEKSVIDRVTEGIDRLNKMREKAENTIKSAMEKGMDGGKSSIKRKSIENLNAMSFTVNSRMVVEKTI